MRLVSGVDPILTLLLVVGQAAVLGMDCQVGSLCGKPKRYRCLAGGGAESIGFESLRDEENGGERDIGGPAEMSWFQLSLQRGKG